mmetsp:Transcript_42292/g.89947  ORF Transcript_42292/g.89947 Transcript_42292/m.89947 type:complete len:270 (-) Transcript_42292:121-930(-)|eukprot:CAMPEP_0172533398 /NCGR_PEP_ID=MMETSP1067-20121228/6124_1 /TAXON_ID=265564 ORGANISM="Thalassiosira punctigera, Strain Tpunct2005C2" /NCGR_SAMPLE_ID=MMETSP1067 /ASSEMBLY_ACC=CAM_ASM_000444 /LENGTH=269 /DNA_ID=CAMNT_0013318043 /DNA_START=205 /DNA_END=1014 /DNA_ORIENTATION=+
MRISSLLLSLAPAATFAAADEQCYGFTPMPSVSTFLDATLQYSTAERICCNNHRYAEFRGYLAAPEVDLFGRLDPTKETVFYDSVCGIPLFVAPRGRSFEEFKEESLRHGWPSFRPEEIVSENVIIHDGGRMESRCLTHLGHNLPDNRDRYCIDLVCVAGEPLSDDDERAKILTLMHASAIDNDEFNATAYASSAEDFSGNYTKFPTRFVIIAAAAVAALMIYFFGIRPVIKNRGDAGKWKGAEQQGSGDSAEVGAGEPKVMPAESQID